MEGQKQEAIDEDEEEKIEQFYLTKLLVDKHRGLLADSNIDIDIFEQLELQEQYEVID